jgi:hypothetical protein
MVNDFKSGMYLKISGCQDQTQPTGYLAKNRLISAATKAIISSVISG